MIPIPQYIISRAIWLMVAMCVLNYSVDSPAPQSDLITEGSIYNKMESVVEIVLEQILGIDDVIAENDEPDRNDKDKRDLHTENEIDVSDDLFTTRSFLKDPFAFESYRSCGREQFSGQFLPELNPPPPKA